MSRHNEKNRQVFEDSMDGCEAMNEEDFRIAMNKTVVNVELDNDYSTNQKLKIYAAMQDLTNCLEKDRRRYVRKVSRLL